MKAILTGIFSGALMVGLAFGQQAAPPGAQTPDPQTQAPAPPQQQMAPAPQAQTQNTQNETTANRRAGNIKIAPGSVIPVSLTKTVDARKAKTGDEVVAKVTQDMKNGSGEILVPKDTKVIGRVTEAQAHSKEQKQSELGIAFDRAVLKNGSQEQLPMSIQAIVGSAPTSAGGAPSGGYDQPGATSSASNTSAGRAGGMPGTSPEARSNTPAGDKTAGATQNGAPSHGPITEKTEGVIGIPDLELTTTAPNAAQGSLVTSEKNNVKLDSGTMLLLRVNR